VGYGFACVVMLCTIVLQMTGVFFYINFSTCDCQMCIWHYTITTPALLDLVNKANHEEAYYIGICSWSTVQNPVERKGIVEDFSGTA
jgi:hypothetical protein